MVVTRTSFLPTGFAYWIETSKSDSSAQRILKKGIAWVVFASVKVEKLGFCAFRG